MATPAGASGASEVENFGRPAGASAPLDISHLAKDPPHELDISLSTTQYPASDSREDQWSIFWEVGRIHGTPAQRRIQVVQEAGVPHLTNWGALTKSAAPQISPAVTTFHLKKMTLLQRKELEEIANLMPVYDPTDGWNGQDWIIGVLQSAEAEGLLTLKEWAPAIDAAQQALARDSTPTPPPPPPSSP